MLGLGLGLFTMHKVGYLPHHSIIAEREEQGDMTILVLLLVCVGLPPRSKKSRSRRRPNVLACCASIIGHATDRTLALTVAAAAVGRTPRSSLPASAARGTGGRTKRARSARSLGLSLAFRRRRASTQLAPGPVSPEEGAGLVLFGVSTEREDNRGEKRHRDEAFEGRRLPISDPGSDCHSLRHG